MKCAVGVFFLVCAGLFAVASAASAQNGAIQIVVDGTPSGGLQEPVRGFPLFLLSKSFEQIQKDAEASDPKPDMKSFIDKLDVSPELKAWMKKNDSVSLSGESFIRKLTPADVLGIPEFRRAYMERNAGEQSVNFPKAKYKASDQQKNPARFKKLSDEYHETLLHYIATYPQSLDGIDLSLMDTDPGSRWNIMLARRIPEIHRRALDWAQSKYLVARMQTDLQGQAALRDIPPGQYWISTLGVAAEIGDVHLKWDVPVTVAPGQTESFALSNFNAVQSSPGIP
ncbi:MAG: hypothetical protein KGL02_04160 [Acidobacteriota bacterium]|nr:hypothetical protein [Acidobacteriota bacterium]